MSVSEAQEQGVAAKPVPLVGMIGLIVKEPIQKELGIDGNSPEMAEIRRVLKPFSTVLQQRLNNPTDEDRVSQLSSQQLYAKIEAEFVAELKTRLRPEQFTRLQQIHWQRWGIRAIEDSDVAKAVELTPDQDKHIAAVRFELQDKRKELEEERRQQRAKGARVDEFKQKLHELDQEYDKQYRQILTPEQLARLTELKGKPIDLAALENPPENPSGAPSPTRHGGLISLIIMEPVLDELGLDEMSAEAAELRKLYRAHTRDLRQQSTSRAPGPNSRDRIRELERSLQWKYELELKNLLTADQFRRLQQIHWQQLGAEAFDDPDVTKLLQISPEQQSQMTTLKIGTFQMVRELLNPPGGSRQVGVPVTKEIQQRVQEIMAERDSRINLILTANQRDQWAEMKGNEFDLKLLRRSLSAP